MAGSSPSAGTSTTVIEISPGAVSMPVNIPDSNASAAQVARIAEAAATAAFKQLVVRLNKGVR
jgi:hypothetical protein